jgi:hypothetical protein
MEDGSPFVIKMTNGSAGMPIGAPIVLGLYASLSARENELISSAERNERERHEHARGRSTQCTNNNDPITSTSEMLLR